MREIHFAVPVWGEAYVDTYLRYSLPLQLSKGNIPAIDLKIRYFIYTRECDSEKIREHATFRKLRKLVDVEFVHIDKDLEIVQMAKDYAKYHLKSKCYRDGLHRASRNDAALVALNCDIALADGFLSAAVDKLNQGKRVIGVIGPRGVIGPVGDVLNAHRSGETIEISPIELTRAWLDNMHPQLSSHFLEGKAGESFYPSHLYWKVGDEGIMVRAFHIYPIIIYSKDNSIMFNNTIDEDLIANLGVTDDEVFVTQDSREMFCCELSEPDYDVGLNVKRGNLSYIANFYRNYNLLNLNTLRKEVVITDRETLGLEWESTRDKSLEVVNHIRELVRGAEKKSWPVLETIRETVKTAMVHKYLFALSSRGKLLRKIFWGNPTVSDGLALYQLYTNKHEDFPLCFEQRVLQICLKEEPNRHDLILRFRDVLKLQGKPIPSAIEKQFAELSINW